MLVERPGVKISYGRAVGHILEDLIGSANERIYVISPWVSPKYANLLLKKKEKGCDVFLITTNDTSNAQHRNSLELLIEKTQVENELKKYWRIFAILSAASFLFGLLLANWLLLFSVIFAIAAFILRSLKYKELFSFKIPMIVYDKNSDFTHSKLYILDKVAVIASANFTESGFWKNIEEIVIFNDKKIVEELNNAFEKIKANELLQPISAEEVWESI